MHFSIKPVRRYRAGYPGGAGRTKHRRFRLRYIGVLAAAALAALWGGCGDDGPTIVGPGDEDAAAEQQADAEADAVDSNEYYDDPWEDIAGGMEPIDGDTDPEPEIDEEEYVMDGGMAVYRTVK